MKTKFLYSEQRLSEVSGISRTELVKLRKEKLVKSRDWRQAKKGKGRPVELTIDGIMLALTTFGISETWIDKFLINVSDDVQAQTSFTTVPGLNNALFNPATKLITAKVSFLCENIRRLNARDAEGKQYEVIVPNNGMWAIGDTLTLRKSEVNPVLYWEPACKPPRFRGDKLHQLQFC